MAFNLSTKAEDTSMKLRTQKKPVMKDETEKLEKESNLMAERLKELKLVMSREREEREKMQQQYWMSGHAGSLYPETSTARLVTSASQHKTSNSVKQQQLQQQRGKYKVTVLKDEPIVVPERAVLPGTLSHLAHRDPTTATATTTSTLQNGTGSTSSGRERQSKCGQCENRSAQVTCVECGEEYCARCFALFHIKGALKKHRSVPIGSSGLRTPRSAAIPPRIAVVRENNNRLERVKELSNVNQNNSSNNNSVPPAVDVGQPSSSSSAGGLLLNGSYQEAESAVSFQQALQAWRHGSELPTPHKNTSEESSRRKPSPKVTDISVGVGDQTIAPTTQPLGRAMLEIKFHTHGLSYAEKLLLKKHRRGEQLGGGGGSTPSPGGDSSVRGGGEGTAASSCSQRSDASTTTAAELSATSGRPTGAAAATAGSELSNAPGTKAPTAAAATPTAAATAGSDSSRSVGRQDRGFTQLSISLARESLESAGRETETFERESNSPGENELAELLGCRPTGEGMEEADHRPVSHYIHDDIEDDDARAESRLSIVELNDTMTSRIVGDKVEKSSQYTVQETLDDKDGTRLFVKSSKKPTTSNDVEELETIFHPSTQSTGKSLHPPPTDKHWQQQTSTSNQQRGDVNGNLSNTNSSATEIVQSNRRDGGRGWKESGGRGGTSDEKVGRSVDCRTVAGIMDRRPRSKYNETRSAGSEPSLTGSVPSNTGTVPTYSGNEPGSTKSYPGSKENANKMKTTSTRDSRVKGSRSFNSNTSIYDVSSSSLGALDDSPVSTRRGTSGPVRRSTTRNNSAAVSQRSPVMGSATRAGQTKTTNSIGSDRADVIKNSNSGSLTQGKSSVIQNGGGGEGLMLKGYKAGLRVRSSPRRRVVGQEVVETSELGSKNGIENSEPTGCGGVEKSVVTAQSGNTSSRATGRSGIMHSSRPASARKSAAASIGELSQPIPAALQEISQLGTAAAATTAAAMTHSSSANLSKFFTLGLADASTAAAAEATPIPDSVAGATPRPGSVAGATPRPGSVAGATPRPGSAASARSRPNSARPKLNNKFYLHGPRSWKPDSSVCDTDDLHTGQGSSSTQQGSPSAHQGSLSAVEGLFRTEPVSSGSGQVPVNSISSYSAINNSDSQNILESEMNSGRVPKASDGLLLGSGNNEPTSPNNTPCVTPRTSSDSETPRNISEIYPSNPTALQQKNVVNGSTDRNEIKPADYSARNSVNTADSRVEVIGNVAGRVTPNLMMKRELMGTGSRPNTERGHGVRASITPLPSSRLSSHSRLDDQPSRMIVMDGDDMSEYDEADYKLQQRLVDDELYDKISSEVTSEAGLNSPTGDVNQIQTPPYTRENSQDMLTNGELRSGNHGDVRLADVTTTERTDVPTSSRLTESRLLYDFDEMEAQLNPDSPVSGSDDEAAVKALQ